MIKFHFNVPIGVNINLFIRAKYLTVYNTTKIGTIFNNQEVMCVLCSSEEGRML